MGVSVVYANNVAILSLALLYYHTALRASSLEIPDMAWCSPDPSDSCAQNPAPAASLAQIIETGSPTTPAANRR
jgi:hypothetical protein